MKTVLVTGANGQLGTSIRCLSGAYNRFQFLFTDVDTLDICKEEYCRSIRKRIIIKELEERYY